MRFLHISISLFFISLFSNSLYFCCIFFSNYMICFSSLISRFFCIASTAVQSLATFCSILDLKLKSSSSLLLQSFQISGITLSWISLTLFNIYYFFFSFSYLCVAWPICCKYEVLLGVVILGPLQQLLLLYSGFLMRSLAIQFFQ